MNWLPSYAESRIINCSRFLVEHLSAYKNLTNSWEKNKFLKQLQATTTSKRYGLYRLTNSAYSGRCTRGGEGCALRRTALARC
jgi:hypothetical protein